MSHRLALAPRLDTAQRVIRMAPRHPVSADTQHKTNSPVPYALKRMRWRDLTFSRVLKGGRISDLGRLWRYSLIVGAGIGLAWGPAIGYLKFGTPAYTSQFSLILPGAGASTSINLSDIGQATSASASAFAGSSISPTVTYKNLLISANVVHAAAASVNSDPLQFPQPTVKLVDETSFISVTIEGPSAAEAHKRARAVMDAFFTELNKLRADETARRDAAIVDTVKTYELAVNVVREKISVLQVKSGLTSSEQFHALVAAADTLASRVAESEAELSRVSQSKAGLSANLGLTDHVASITMKLHADPQFAALTEATSKAEAEYASAAKEFGERHPKVVEARARLGGAKAQMMDRASKITGIPAKKLTGKIDFSPTGERSALLSQLVTLSTSADGLEGQISTMKLDLAARREKVSQLVTVAADLDRLTSEHKVAEAVFASALARISTAKTDIFASYPMAQVSEPPIVPLTPSSPNKKIAYGAAVAASVLLVLGLLLGWIRRPLIDKLLNALKRKDGQSKPA
jgi:uncharacterized protein involved in exopolysaccharide biosynthesis